MYAGMCRLEDEEHPSPLTSHLLWHLNGDAPFSVLMLQPGLILLCHQAGILDTQHCHPLSPQSSFKVMYLLTEGEQSVVWKMHVLQSSALPLNMSLKNKPITQTVYF